MTQDEQKMHQLAEDTAAGLSGFRMENTRRDYGHYVQICGPNSAAIGFRLDARKKTILLSGVFPADSHGKPYELPYHEKTPQISVSLNKTGPQIAADIARRLWPLYEPLLLAALESHAMWARRENTSLAIANQLAEIVEAPVDPRSPSDVRINLYKSGLLPEFQGDIVVSGESVRLDRFYLSPSQAEAVLKVLVRSR